MVNALPQSLYLPDLAPWWQAVRDRLDRYGPDHRGRVRVPELSTPATVSLASLLGQRRLTKTVHLSALEHALARYDPNLDLNQALVMLGFAPSATHAQRRSHRQRLAQARDMVRSQVGRWPEPWATSWIEDLIAAGQFSDYHHAQAATLVDDVRRVLAVLDHPTGLLADAAGKVARVDLAARATGSAHALDTGQPLERATRRALWHRHHHHAGQGTTDGQGSIDDEGNDEGDADRRDDDFSLSQGTEIWSRAGVHIDTVSAPVLTWGLRLCGPPALATLTTAATDAGLVLHLTNQAFTTALAAGQPLAVPAGTVVLVAENPRVVEAAASRLTPWPVIATNGNPTSAVLRLVSGLIEAGADVGYHGDFDRTGLAICARMHAAGARPWRMNAHDYVAACDRAASDGITPLTDRGAAAVVTPWDPALATEFSHRRVVIHEEYVLGELVAHPPFNRTPLTTA